MNETDPGLLRFELPEAENKRLREENARLRRLLATHSTAIPQIEAERPSTSTDLTAPPVDKEARTRRRTIL